MPHKEKFYDLTRSLGIKTNDAQRLMRMSRKIFNNEKLPEVIQKLEIKELKAFKKWFISYYNLVISANKSIEQIKQGKCHNFKTIEELNNYLKNI